MTVELQRYFFYLASHTKSFTPQYMIKVFFCSYFGTEIDYIVSTTFNYKITNLSFTFFDEVASRNWICTSLVQIKKNLTRRNFLHLLENSNYPWCQGFYSVYFSRPDIEILQEQVGSFKEGLSTLGIFSTASVYISPYIQEKWLMLYWRTKLS